MPFSIFLSNNFKLQSVILSFSRNIAFCSVFQLQLNKILRVTPQTAIYPTHPPRLSQPKVPPPPQVFFRGGGGLFGGVGCGERVKEKGKRANETWGFSRIAVIWYRRHRSVGKERKKWEVSKKIIYKKLIILKTKTNYN